MYSPIDEPQEPSADSMKAPLAVVTVTYSPGEHLSHLLDSLSHATVRGTYTILADNGSTDGVPERESHRESVEFLSTGGNLGYGRAMNAGVRYAEHLRDAGRVDPQWILLVNPDVEFCAGSIDALISAGERWISRGFAVATVGPRIENNDGTTYPSARSVPDLVNGTGHALFGRVWPRNPWSARYRSDDVMDVERAAGWLSGSCLLVAWDVFTELGGFDDHYFMYMEDVDLGDRCGRAGYTNVYTPSAVIHHDQGHAAKKQASTMIKAHHASVYRFLADRHSRWWEFPLRCALRVGLALRERVSLVKGKV